MEMQEENDEEFQVEETFDEDMNAPIEQVADPQAALLLAERSSLL